MIEILIGVLIGLVLCVTVFLILQKSKAPTLTPTIEVEKENIKALAEYVSIQKHIAEEKQKEKDFKKSENKQKLEVFKQTREQLKEKLKSQITAKEWRPLQSVLNSADKGGVGLYIIYNQTKNKYYVGQAKQLFKRIRDHFAVEQMAIDYLQGDQLHFKFLTANELDADYRLDHVEKTGIEIFQSDIKGYNKTVGNL
ncbi:MAG: GIY-YIG nuclease family protein [Firmicutes bacterium]|nr:GIY-YIG nuclease family protein [Bacillota bacterium]